MATDYNRVVRELAPLTPEELTRAERRLLNPAPFSRIAAARGIRDRPDTLLDRLRLTPEQRATRMLELCQLAESIRGRALWKNS